MKTLKILSIYGVLFVFLLGFSGALFAQQEPEYKPFTGAKLSFTDSIIKVNPECNKQPYYPAYGVAYQQLLNQVQGSASGGDRTVAQ
jgi:hypothetical protein